MSTTTEWAMFRKVNYLDPVERPFEQMRYASKERCEAAIATYRNGPEWLEARCREVSDWTKPSTYSEAEIEDLRARLTGGRP